MQRALLNPFQTDTACLPTNEHCSFSFLQGGNTSVCKAKWQIKFGSDPKYKAGKGLFFSQINPLGWLFIEHDGHLTASGTATLQLRFTVKGTSSFQVRAENFMLLQSNSAEATAENNSSSDNLNLQVH